MSRTRPLGSLRGQIRVAPRGSATGWPRLVSQWTVPSVPERYLRRAGGYYYLYGQSAFDQVLGTHLAGVAEWEARLVARGRPVRRRKRPPPAAPLHAGRMVTACR